MNKHIMSFWKRKVEPTACLQYVFVWFQYCSLHLWKTCIYCVESSCVEPPVKFEWWKENKYMLIGLAYISKVRSWWGVFPSNIFLPKIIEHWDFWHTLILNIFWSAELKYSIKSHFQCFCDLKCNFKERLWGWLCQETW